MRKLIATAAIILGSCANPYSKFYQGEADGRRLPYYEQSHAPLQIYSTNDFDRDRLGLIRRGYIPIGRSSFNAGDGSVTEVQLREQAAQIGAHVALVSTKYSHTVSGALPLTLPNNQTSYSTGNATVYSGGKTATVYGSGTTTTYGTQTTMIPYSVSRSDFAAIFFVKAKARVGLYVDALDDASRRRLESNFGVRVLVVTEGTSAFEADVLPGDTLLAIGEDRVQSPQHMTQLLIKYEGQVVQFSFDRDGKRLEKRIEVRAFPQTK